MLITVLVGSGLLILLAMYMLSRALMVSTNRLTQMNEKLLVMLATRDGDVAGARSLVAMSKPPQGKGPESVVTTEKPKEGVTVSYGAM